MSEKNNKKAPVKTSAFNIINKLSYFLASITA